MSEGRWFTLLGPVTAACGGRELDLGTPQQKAVLAALLLRPGQHVPLHQLVDWLWDVDPPRTAEQMIRTYVYRLRKSLRAGVSADPIASVGTGYLVRVAPEELDMSVFRIQVEKAQQAKAAGDLATAHRLLREGLSLWTGDPLADLVGVPAEAARTRLRALQLDAVEQSLDLGLELGRFGEAAYQLSELVAAHPLDERFARLLMRALNGSGRQADALAVYSDVRRRLADELGIDPGAALQETHVRILRAERPRESGNEQPVVRASSSTATARRAPRVPSQPPADLPWSGGWGAELTQLDCLLSDRNGPVPIMLLATMYGYAYAGLGRHHEAVSCYTAAIALIEQPVDPFIEAKVRIHLGDSHLALGDTAAARRCWRHAAQLLAGLGHPMVREAHRRLAGQPRAEIA